MKLVQEIELPNRNVLRRLRELPNLPKLIRDKDQQEPHTPKPDALKFEPTRTNDLRLSALPALRKSNTLIAEPNRAELRRDMPLPSATKCSTEVEPPNLA
jgi:hypothetical protein